MVVAAKPDLTRSLREAGQDFEHEKLGLSQIALARRAGVTRMRLQLGEAGEITLRSEEIAALDRVPRDAIERGGGKHEPTVQCTRAHRFSKKP